MAPSNSELPVWRSGLYIGVFGDAFLENTDFEGGLLEPTMRSLADAVEAAMAPGGAAAPLARGFAHADALARALALLREGADTGDAVEDKMGFLDAADGVLEQRLPPAEAHAEPRLERRDCGGQLGVHRMRLVPRHG